MPVTMNNNSLVGSDVLNITSTGANSVTVNTNGVNRITVDGNGLSTIRGDILSYNPSTTTDVHHKQTYRTDFLGTGSAAFSTVGLIEFLGKPRTGGSDNVLATISGRNTTFSSTAMQNTTAGILRLMANARDAVANTTSSSSVVIEGQSVTTQTTNLTQTAGNFITPTTSTIRMEANTVSVNFDTVDTTFSNVLRVRTNGVAINLTTPSCALDINSNKMRLRTAQTPASATAAGNQGDIVWDASYLYICVATNSWKRTLLSAW